MPQCSAPPYARHGGADWRAHGSSWPLHETSEFRQVGRFVWHVQRTGSGPTMLLLHGTGAGTHSWAPLIKRLQDAFSLIAVDLPGHGFTVTPRGFTPSLPNMARALNELLKDLDLVPDIVVGHSAGAAIAIHMAATQADPAKMLFSINGALKPFPGLMRLIAPVTAKAAAFGGVASYFVSRNASGVSRVRNLVKSIGSDPDQVDIAPYSILLQSRGHIQGALQMMAHWDLSTILRDCRRLEMPISFIVGGSDQAVPPRVSEHAAGQAQRGTYLELPGLGHLAHEEAPDKVAALIRQNWDRDAADKERAQDA